MKIQTIMFECNLQVFKHVEQEHFSLLDLLDRTLQIEIYKLKYEN